MKGRWGWGRSTSGRMMKHHYFVGRKSICGRWLVEKVYVVKLVPGSDDYCNKCKNKLRLG